MGPPRARFVWEIDWNLLRTFMVIVQEQSLTAAGDKLSLAQPTISNALRRLESHMGCRLIDRSSRQFKPTPAGEKLHAECVAMFHIVSSLPDIVSDHDGEVSGHIEMAFASHVVCPFFDEFLAGFIELYPQITFSTSVSSSQAVAEAVHSGNACLGVCLSNAPRADLDYVLLYREAFGFFCAPGHPLFGQLDVDLGDLRGLDYVSFKTDQLEDALWPVAQFRQNQGFHGRILGLFTNLEEVTRMMKVAGGFAPLPIHVVEHEVAAGQLWQLPPREGLPVVDVYLVTSLATRKSKAAALFLESLAKAMAGVRIEERTYPSRIDLALPA